MKIRILNLGVDRGVLEKDSGTIKRLQAQAEATDFYAVLVPFEEKKELEITDKMKSFSSGGKNKLTQLFNMYIEARRIVKDCQVNIISTQDPFEFGLIAYLIKVEMKVAWHTQEHGDFFSQPHWRREAVLNNIRYHLGRFLVKKADSIRVVSQRQKEYFVEILRINKEKLVNVPVLTKYNKNEMLAKRDNEDFVFLTMGRFVDQKNLPMLLRAFKRVKDIHKKTKLIIIGKGPREGLLKQMLKDLKIESSVELKTWVDNVYDHYLSANAYVLSSNYEGWGRVIIEAAATKLPIAMTDVGCAGEVIKNNESGLVAKVGDTQEFAEAMIRLIEDKDLREGLAVNAYEAIKELPDEQKTIELYKKSWQIALENNK